MIFFSLMIQFLTTLCSLSLGVNYSHSAITLNNISVLSWWYLYILHDLNSIISNRPPFFQFLLSSELFLKLIWRLNIPWPYKLLNILCQLIILNTFTLNHLISIGFLLYNKEAEAIRCAGWTQIEVLSTASANVILQKLTLSTRTRACLM